MIDDDLIKILACPDCRIGLEKHEDHLHCINCGREYSWKPEMNYVDMRPTSVRSKESIYADEEFQTARGLMDPGPPFLSGGIKNWILRSLVPFKEGDLVLDAGCGAGRYILWNQNENVIFTGIDQIPFFSPAIEDKAYLVQGFLHYLPLVDSAFDAIICLDVLEHMALNDIKKFLDGTSRILKKGGKLFIYTNSVERSRLQPLIKFRQMITSFFVAIKWINLDIEQRFKEDHLNAIETKDQLIGLAAQYGLRLVDRVYYNPVIMGWYENLFIKIIERFLDKKIEKKEMKLKRLPSIRRTGLKNNLSSAKRLMKEKAEKKGPVYYIFKIITGIMKLDIILFSNVKAGQFFLLFEKD